MNKKQNNKKLIPYQGIISTVKSCHWSVVATHLLQVLRSLKVHFLQPFVDSFKEIQIRPETVQVHTLLENILGLQEYKGRGNYRSNLSDNIEERCKDEKFVLFLYNFFRGKSNVHKREGKSANGVDRSLFAFYRQYLQNPTLSHNCKY